MGEIEPDGQYLPDDAEHATQVDEDDAPEVVEYLPTGQAIHSEEPVSFVYLPATHSTHVPPLGPNEPALHVQSSAESLPGSEYFPAMQSVHWEAPAVGEYLPAAQGVHFEALAAENLLVSQ